MNEVTRTRSLLSFKLYLEQFERRVVTAAYEKTIGARVELTRWKCVAGWPRLHDLKILATKLCVRARPRLEAADAVVDLGCGAGKIHEPIFFPKNWR